MHQVSCSCPPCLRLFWLLASLSPSCYGVSINVTGPTSSQFVLKGDTEYWLAHSIQISGTLLFGCCVVKIFRFGDTSEQEGVCTIIYPYWLGWLTKESADSQYIIYYSLQITNTNPVARISVGNVSANHKFVGTLHLVMLQRSIFNFISWQRCG